MINPPQVPLEYTDLPHDPKARHEALVDAFGYMLFWLRNQSLRQITSLVTSKAARGQVAKLFRKAYEEAGKLTPDQQQVALKLAGNSVDLFARLMLTMLAGTGTDQRLGTDHAVCFRLQMEIKNLETGNIVADETINRNGKKFFPEYWGRWLKQYGGV